MMNKINNNRILVTGGAGFIGSHLCDEILKQNPKKLIIVDNLCQSDGSNIKHLRDNVKVDFRQVDICVNATIRDIVLASDIVFHLAAGNVGMSEIDPRTNINTNVIGTFNILEAIREKPEIRMIYASSGSVVNPSTVYSIGKLSAEQLVSLYVQKYGLKATSVRYHHVFGPRQDTEGKCGVINIFLSRILKGQPPIVWGSGNAIKNFTYVSDSVRATLMLAEKPIGGVYDIASDNLVSIKELAELIIKKYAVDKTMTPEYTSAKPGENMRLFPSVSGLKALGWSTEFSFEEGLDRCAEWVKLNK